VSSADEIAGADVPERTPSMAWQTVEGETVLLNIDGRELLGLNAVGARVWDLCTGATIDEIAAAVAHEFDVSGERAGADVRQFVAQLVAAGALTLRRS
jgi:hypothetical protein